MDRTRNEDVVQKAVDELRAGAQAEGYTVLDAPESFVLASYADGYELWLRVVAKPEALKVRSDR